MGSKIRAVYVCGECGFETSRWYGKCPSCGHWNTLTEQVRASSNETAISEANSAAVAAKIEQSVFKLAELEKYREIRRRTGLSELDRVLGSGAVDGSVILLSGDPGIGKSTLLLQVCKTICEDQSVLYVSGEESPRQIKLRADRLGVDSERLYIAPITDMETVLHTINRIEPDVVIVDSIQTMRSEKATSSPGSVGQVRESAMLLINAAKSLEIPIFIVGHVNKDGGIAGPKVLEHMVDVVLYFEGDRHSSYRILRAVKNRFGSTGEIGVFEMKQQGLRDVENPSQMLLSGRPTCISGTCVACVMEGSRPILAEVQALVGKTGFGTPRRMATGFDLNRVALLIAVLEKRGGFFFGNLDAYVNIIGGLRLDEPGADLPVVLALASNLLDKPIHEDVAAFGEVGLAGEIRAISHIESRVGECVRLGFKRIIVPRSEAGQLEGCGAAIIPVSNISQCISKIL